MKKWLMSKSLAFQLSIMVFFVVINLTFSVVLAYFIVNEIKVGGDKFTAIEQKLATVDSIARLRMNINFMRGRLLGQLLEYDDEVAATLPNIANRLQEQISVLQNSVVLPGENAERNCSSCHAADHLEDINDQFASVADSIDTISSLISNQILPALEDEDEETAIELVEDNFGESYAVVMTESKPVVDMMRDATDLVKKKSLKFAELAVLAYALFGVLVILFTIVSAWYLVRLIVNIVTSATHGLTVSSHEITEQARTTSESSLQVAEMSSEMAASIEEVSASIEEITAMGQRNAENSTASNSLMQKAKETNETANTQMQEMLVTMQDIKKDSDSIAGIIGDIEGIAFQTNLLALNAAVKRLEPESTARVLLW